MITTKVISVLGLHLNLILRLGLYQSEELINFRYSDPVPDTDSLSLFRFPHHCEIGFRDLLACFISLQSLGEMNDFDK